MWRVSVASECVSECASVCERAPLIQPLCHAECNSQHPTQAMPTEQTTPGIRELDVRENVMKVMPKLTSTAAAVENIICFFCFFSAVFAVLCWQLHHFSIINLVDLAIRPVEMQCELSDPSVCVFPKATERSATSVQSHSCTLRVA